LIEFHKALIFDSRSQAGVNGLMQLFSQRRPTRASIARIEKMAAAPPASATLFEIAGRLYQLIGRKADAERALARSLALDDRRASAALALWQMDRVALPRLRDRAGQSLLQASAAELQGASDVALRDYENALARGDRSGVAANNLAFAYAVRGQNLNRALDLAAQAVERMPHRPEPVDTLGVVLLKMRQYSAASQAFERALTLKPDTVASRQIALHLAEAYDASGLPEKAAEVRARLRKTKS
jgi:tetratricopeptide (TPR) repeat protein